MEKSMEGYENNSFRTFDYFNLSDSFACSYSVIYSYSDCHSQELTIDNDFEASSAAPTRGRDATGQGRQKHCRPFSF